MLRWWASESLANCQLEVDKDSLTAVANLDSWRLENKIKLCFEVTIPSSMPCFVS